MNNNTSAKIVFLDLNSELPSVERRQIIKLPNFKDRFEEQLQADDYCNRPKPRNFRQFITNFWNWVTL
jgi:hypothetical protein